MYQTRYLPNTRIDVADALRGIAVAGIILYHSVEHFDIFTKEPIVYTLPCDDLVGKVLAWLLSGKMYGIFAMLWSFCLAYVFVVRVWSCQRGILRWRHPHAICRLWLVAYSHQFSAIESGMVHHRFACHSTRRIVLLINGYNDRPHSAL